MKIFHQIPFNSQRDNKSFNNLRPASAQCFPTCAWMFMSFFCKDIDALDDRGLALFLNEVERKIPGGSFAEDFIKANPNKLPKNVEVTSIYWDVIQYGINRMFDLYGVDKIARWDEVAYERLPSILHSSPLIFGTKLTASGHIILLTGIDKQSDSFHVNDPYGNYTTGYKDLNGQTTYTADLILQTGEACVGKKNMMRVMYAV